MLLPFASWETNSAEMIVRRAKASMNVEDCAQRSICLRFHCWLKSHLIALPLRPRTRTDQLDSHACAQLLVEPSRTSYANFWRSKEIWFGKIRCRCRNGSLFRSGQRAFIARFKRGILQNDWFLHHLTSLFVWNTKRSGYLCGANCGLNHSPLVLRRRSTKHIALCRILECSKVLALWNDSNANFGFFARKVRVRRF